MSDSRDFRPARHTTQSHPRQSEPLDNKIDEVIGFLDKMNFKPSKSRSMLAVDTAESSDRSEELPCEVCVDPVQTVPRCEHSPGSSASQSSSDEDDLTATTSPRDHQSFMATPPRDQSLRDQSPVAHIPDSMLARRSHSAENCTSPHSASNELSLEPVECEESSHDMPANPLSQITDTLPTSIMTPSHHVPATDGAKVVMSSGRYDRRPSFRGASKPHWSLRTASDTPRHLSADAAYCLEQEEGDLIIESAGEEDSDNDEW